MGAQQAKDAAAAAAAVPAPRPPQPSVAGKSKGKSKDASRPGPSTNIFVDHTGLLFFSGNQLLSTLC